MRLLEWAAIFVIALALAVGIIVLLSGGLLAGRDNPGIYGNASTLGVTFKNQGDALLTPGAKRPAYDSEPPTSGPHHPASIRREGDPLTDDQLLQALSRGDVVLMYGSRRPPRSLSTLVRSVAAPFSPPLAAAGQAVILAPRPGSEGVIALAWTHLLHVRSASDPELRSFTAFWLGQGARSAPPATTSTSHTASGQTG